MNFIADERLVYESPDPQNIYCYTPGLLTGFPGKNGCARLIAVVDLSGPRLRELCDGPVSEGGDYQGNQLRVLISDDGGVSWTETGARIPMRHEVMFKTEDALYMMGNDPHLVITRSTDNGETWSAPAVLEGTKRWHQSCCSVDIHNGMIYLVYEQLKEVNYWPNAMPVLMAANLSGDLLKPESWRFSEPFDCDTIMNESFPSGIPLFCKASADPNRWSPVPGILETNVARIYDKENPLWDPEDRSVILCMRTYVGHSDIGAILVGRDEPDGTLTIKRALSRTYGTEPFLVAWPGGNMKFHLQYDVQSKMYWMVASQIDGVHCERRRLGLYYSPNLWNWTFAGIVAVGPTENGSRHYATLAIDGDDLLVLSRSGDERAKDAHDNNLVTFHRVKDFRSLVG